MKHLILALIRFYRKNISPARPPCCRFIPSCSRDLFWPCGECFGAIRFTEIKITSMIPYPRKRATNLGGQQWIFGK